MSNFAERLEELMYDKRTNAKTFAAVVGISESCITEYLHGRSLPTLCNLITIADFFHCSTDFLLGREEFNDKLSFKECPPFSERLEILLNYFGCTPAEFYEKAKITKSRFFDWKSGKRTPSVDNLLKIAEGFGCRIDFIIGRES